MSCSFHDRAVRTLGAASLNAGFASLLGTFQLLENAIVAAESLRLRLPNQPLLIDRVLQDASDLRGT